jgi:GPH family glycoside/pentoside/hexuronide:cation symporter
VKPNHKNAPFSERVKTSEAVAFSLGTLLDALSVSLVTGTLWMPFFNIGLGFNAASLSVILVIFRIWDAMTDPIVGNLSDNTRTRWGRRRPYIFGGAIATALFSVMFWFVPEGLDETKYLAALTLMGMLFFTAFAFWAMPYYSLQMEMTPNYDERTRLNAWVAAVGKISLLIGGGVLWLVGSNLFADPATGRADIVKGVRFVTPFLIVPTILAGIAPALFVRERYYESEAKFQKKEALWTSISETVSCKPLWFLIGITFFQMLGGMVIDGLGFYINAYKVSGGNISEAAHIEFLKKLVMVISGLCLIPFWTWLAEIWDKKTVAALLLLSGIFGIFISFFCIRPDMIYLQLIPAAFGSGVASAVWLILPSMKADIADFDELETGKRREGSINGIFSWFMKAALAGSLGVSGIIIQYIAGIDPKLTIQPPEVIDRLFMAYLVIPAIILVIPLFFIWRYPLTRERMFKIRSELEARRGCI